MIVDGIEYIGIGNREPNQLEYFNQIKLNDEFNLIDKKTNIKSIISVSTVVNTNIIQIIDTPIRISAEGKNLKGKKIMTELKIKHEIRYLGEGSSSYIYMDNLNLLKLGSIVMPQKINDRHIEELLRKNKIKIDVYIEDVYIKLIEKRKINLNMLLVLNSDVKMG